MKSFVRVPRALFVLVVRKVVVPVKGPDAWLTFSGIARTSPLRVWARVIHKSCTRLSCTLVVRMAERVAQVVAPQVFLLFLGWRWRFVL